MLRGTPSLQHLLADSDLGLGKSSQWTIESQSLARANCEVIMSPPPLAKQASSNFVNEGQRREILLVALFWFIFLSCCRKRFFQHSSCPSLLHRHPPCQRI